ncbi:methyl-accepting chemotaxis protein [Methylovulum psychrotolerans]|uniref:Methyl-accepting chemotaxis protein n=1 Tax=Methylovulum psychrotolerans TaxID=1704499 RepID=A0A1Z4C1I2_9GAMM|nr:methyl-accepting chemotaxis protein [Methylovulum psychrotolerans]ASF47385.1 hypothetical protein CEK71_15670 [Methylovulum psychrotolerans]
MAQAHITPFSGLLLRQKFAILALLALVLVGTAFYSVIDSQWDKINETKREQQGLRLAKELLALSQLLSKHRAYSVGFMGNGAAESQAAQHAIERKITDIDTLSQTIGDTEVQELWENFKQEWPKIARKARDHSVTPPELFRSDAWLIAKVRDILTVIIDHYGLALDPNPESYFLIRAILVDAPLIAEYIDQANGWGTGLLLQAAERATKKIPADTLSGNLPRDRGRLILMLSIANEHLDTAEQNFNHFLNAEHKQADPKAQESLNSQFNTTTALIKKAIELADTQIITQAALDYPPANYFSRHSLAINEMYNEITLGVNELDAIFSRQIQSASLTLLALAVVIITLIAGCTLVALYITNSITRPVGLLVDVMQKLAAGDNSVRAHLQTHDEIGLLGRQFDLMVDQREAVRRKIEQEKEWLNNSIVELLVSVGKLAQKDLTVQAVAAGDVTGPLAEALNLLTYETAHVLQRVTQIADEVAHVSQQVQSQSARVIDVAADEKREVEQAAHELGAASKAMLEVAKLAASCNLAAEKAINNTDKAQATVSDTINGITSIRTTIRETEKRIKRLGERSQEIGGIVNIINDVAERTHVLALNATMQASSAGEAGRGFAVVANEVQKLAESSREATLKISSLVNSIQAETANTITTMNNAISQVVRGTELAQQAGDEMQATRDTTAILVHLVQTIASSSTQQSEVSKRLVERARQIQNSTEETYSQLQDQSRQTELLVNLSGDLVSSVGIFTLPEVAA